MDNVQLQDINFFTTYKCNSRCKNCHIWKGKLVPPSRVEMDEACLNRLFADPLFVKCGGIGLAGGEPTIAPFTWQLLDLLPTDKQVTITTNALNSSKLVDFLRNCEDRDRYTVQLSLDGIGDENDHIRGVKGGYQKTLDLLKEAEKLGVKRLLSFTINQLNLHQLVDCYELAQTHGAEFSTRMAYTGGAYSNSENQDVYRFEQDALQRLEQDLDDIIARETTAPSHYPAKVVFLKKIVDYYKGEQADLPCYAMESGMVIDLYGNVFPNCPVMMNPIGNLHEAGLQEIWQSDRAEQIRSDIAKFTCGGCWNDCQVITNISYDRNFLEEQYSKIKVAACKIDALSVPAVLDFNSSDSSLLLTGWYGPEGDADFRYRWTEQQFSFLIPPGTSSLELFAMAPDNLDGKERKLDVFVEGERESGVTFKVGEWEKYTISLQTTLTQAAVCRLRLSSYYCPKELGKGNDLRRLGAAVNKIIFS